VQDIGDSKIGHLSLKVKIWIYLVKTMSLDKIITMNNSNHVTGQMEKCMYVLLLLHNVSSE